MQLINYDIEIDKNLVLKYLGYKDKTPPQMVVEEVGRCVEESYKFIKSAICYDQFQFKVTDGILLPNGEIIKGYIIESLIRSDYVVMAVLTLGEKIDEKIADLFAKNDYMEGMIYDVIGNVGLEYLGKKFWQELLKDAKGKGMGITQSLSPGTGGWKDIKDQKVIFNNLDTSSIGVKLTDSFMMKPIKSLSTVYGIGKEIKTSQVDHDCAECPLVDCPYRKEMIKCTE